MVSVVGVLEGCEYGAWIWEGLQKKCERRVEWQVGMMRILILML